MDMRDAAPWNVYRPHVGMVESVVLFRHILFSAGDKSVLGSDIHSGETLGRVTRDSGKIPILMVCGSLWLSTNLILANEILFFILTQEKDGQLYCCSSNGSIRTFLITHNLNRMTIDKTMWEHSRSIKQCMKSFPSQGNYFLFPSFIQSICDSSTN